MRSQAFSAGILILLASAGQGAADNPGQFQQFFSAWNEWLLTIIDTHCRPEREAYDDYSGLRPSFSFANCILQHMDEAAKVEMGVSSLLLGLLPTILQSIGPSVDEITILAMRRPALAFILSFGMPFVRADRSPLAYLKHLEEPSEVDLIRWLVEIGSWPWAFITIVEYLLGAAATANVFWLVHQLAFQSVSISAIAIETFLPETYPAFLWILLLMPIHVLSYIHIRLAYRLRTAPLEKQVADGKRKWIQTISAEFKPCALNRPLYVEVRKHDVYIVISAMVSWLTNLAILVLFIFGTVFLSSQMFIGLGDMIPVIGRVVGSCMVARAVLNFELYGMRWVTAKALRATNDSPSVTKSTYHIVPTY